jgi:hypothetical protein
MEYVANVEDDEGQRNWIELTQHSEIRRRQYPRFSMEQRAVPKISSVFWRERAALGFQRAECQVGATI